MSTNFKVDFVKTAAREGTALLLLTKGISVLKRFEEGISSSVFIANFSYSVIVIKVV